MEDDNNSQHICFFTCFGEINEDIIRSPGCHSCLIAEDNCNSFEKENTLFCYVDPSDPSCHTEECKRGDFVPLPGSGYTKGVCEGCRNPHIDSCESAATPYFGGAARAACECVIDCEGGNDLHSCAVGCLAGLAGFDMSML